MVENSERLCTTYTRLSQENSLGHNSRPVCSLAKPRSSFDRARRGGSEAPNMSMTQPTAAVLRWLVSSPLAMSAPLRNWKVWYQKRPSSHKIKIYIFIKYFKRFSVTLLAKIFEYWDPLNQYFVRLHHVFFPVIK